jgi:hypothetical protein
MKSSHCASIFLLIFGLGGCSTVGKVMDFDSYCESSGFKFDVAERPSGPHRLLLDRSAVTHDVYQRRAHIFRFPDLARIANLEAIYEKTRTGTRYRKYWKNHTFEVVRETDANIILKFETLTSEADHEVDLFGEQMTISDRASGRTIATYRYFWKSYFWSPDVDHYCPRNRAKALHPAGVAAYVIDPGSPLNERDLGWLYLPLPQ